MAGGALEAVLVALGGGVGAAARYAMDLGVTALARRYGRGTRGFPWGITLVNLLGSFLLGVLLGLGLDESRNGIALTAVSAGLLGGFTTFSTAALDTLRLLREKHPWLATLNAFGTLGAAVLLASAGIALSMAR